MEPSGHKPASSDGGARQETTDDRKPAARSSPRGEGQQPGQLPVRPQPSQSPLAQLPSVAVNESSSASTELMLRLLETTQTPAPGTSAGSLAASQIDQAGPLESMLRRELGLGQSSAGNATEQRLANLHAQALLKQQEESLRHTRLLLQRFMEESSANAASRETSRASRQPNTEVLRSQLVVDGGVSSSTADAAITPGATEGRNNAPVQSGNLARATSQESAPVDGDDTNSNNDNNSHAESFCPDDDDDLNDDDYFKNFDTEDSHKLNNETFPFRLYRMLYEVEKSGRQDIASFASRGHAFVVHRPKRFVEEIMPTYFSTSRLASFQRQLNLYGFSRISEGGLRGGYYHQYFQKGKRALCRKIKRQRTRARANSSSGGSNSTRANPTLPVSISAATSLTGGYSNLPIAAASAVINADRLSSQASAAEIVRQAAADELNRMLENRRSDLSLQNLLDSSLLRGRPIVPSLGSSLGFSTRASAQSLLSLPPLRTSFTTASNNTRNLALDLHQALQSSRLPPQGRSSSSTEQKDGRP